MEPAPALDTFRRREIEQQLTADLHAANQRLRNALSDEEKRQALEAYSKALQRITDFAARGLVPKDLLPSGL
jgi:hypothetical protein